MHKKLLACGIPKWLFIQMLSHIMLFLLCHGFSSVEGLGGSLLVKESCHLDRKEGRWGIVNHGNEMGLGTFLVVVVGSEWCQLFLTLALNL
jgi:hypothetical protein